MVCVRVGVSGNIRHVGTNDRIIICFPSFPPSGFSFAVVVVVVVVVVLLLLLLLLLLHSRVAITVNRRCEFSPVLCCECKQVQQSLPSQFIYSGHPQTNNDKPDRAVSTLKTTLWQ